MTILKGKKLQENTNATRHHSHVLNYDTSEAIHTRKQSHGTEQTAAAKEKGAGGGVEWEAGVSGGKCSFTEWVNYMSCQREP